MLMEFRKRERIYYEMLNQTISHTNKIQMRLWFSKTERASRVCETRVVGELLYTVHFSLAHIFSAPAEEGELLDS